MGKTLVFPNPCDNIIGERNLKNTSVKWEQVKFSDLYLVPSKNGLTKPSRVRGHGFKMINMGELFSHDRIYDIPMELVPLSDNEKEKNAIKINDLLFARQSLVLEGAGKCSIVMKTSGLTVFESHLIRVRLNQEIANPLFYYYYFKSGCSPIKTIVSQCAQAGIRASDLSDLIVQFPPLPTQRRIADILSAYDDLIENNRRQIKLLEEAAQRLYKEWFVDLRFPGHEHTKIVDGVPEGWRKGLLGEIICVNYGKDHKKVPNEGTIPVYGSGGLMRRCDTALHAGEAVLVPRKGSLNNIMYVNESFWTVDTMFYVKVNIPNAVLFTYFFLRSHDMYSMNIGAAVPSMTVKTLESLSVVFPDGNLLRKFNDVVQMKYRLINQLQRKIDSLTEAHDRLLPKLMNGVMEL